MLGIGTSADDLEHTQPGCGRRLAASMSAVAARYSQRDLATIMGFMERGIEISRDYRAKLRGGKER